MKRCIEIIFIAAVLCQLTSCAQEKAAVSFRNIPVLNDSIRIVGRVKKENNTVCVYWPGTAIQVQFKGTSMKAVLDDETGSNYFNIIVDGKYSHYIDLQPGEHEYTVVEDLMDGTHSVQIIKRTEWDQGHTWFRKISISGQLLAIPKSTERIIEFFGNSITAGYAIEDSTGRDSPEGLNTDNYNTYASLTARHFEADLYLTIKSGIGVTVSWFPLIMPEMYNRLDPRDSTSRWDFHVQPQVVVVNLFQNDSWLVSKPDHPSFIQRFGNRPPTDAEMTEAYSNFIHDLRNVYPKAYIICTLGSMSAVKPGSPWPQYVQQAVEQLNDERILCHFFPYIERNGHPTKQDNVDMANSLIAFIGRNVTW